MIKCLKERKHANYSPPISVLVLSCWPTAEAKALILLVDLVEVFITSQFAVIRKVKAAGA